MKLLDYKEKIRTECDRLDNPSLETRAIKLDSNTGFCLKNDIQCYVKSCDYLRKKNDTLYFIEFSDFKYEYEDLIKAERTEEEAKKIIKKGMQQKISDTLLIFNECLKRFKISIQNINSKKVLITLCTTDNSDVVAFDYLSRSLESNYKPNFIESIKVVSIVGLEELLKVK